MEVKNAAEMKSQLLEVIANQSLLLKLKKNAQMSHRQPDVFRTVDAILATEHHYLPIQDGLQFSYANV
ncbi:hypothetical protein D3C85_1854780 [compost metagenome]